MTYGARLKKKCQPEFGPSLLVFLEIAYSDSLHSCLTSSGGKIHENFFLGGGGGASQA